jgi:hypothetical protein
LFRNVGAQGGQHGDREGEVLLLDFLLNGFSKNGFDVVVHPHLLQSFQHMNLISLDDSYDLLIRDE